MTFKILKSSLTAQGATEEVFSAAVTAYISAMAVFSQTSDTPRPVAHALVESAAKRIQEIGQPDTYVADYEVINDDPPPPTVAEKRTKLIQQSRTAEMEVGLRILPEGKRRLLNLEQARISVIKEDERIPEDKALFERIQATNKRLNDLYRHGAEVEAEIESLPEDQLDTFVLPAIPE